MSTKLRLSRLRSTPSPAGSYPGRFSNPSLSRLRYDTRIAPRPSRSRQPRAIRGATVPSRPAVGGASTAADPPGLGGAVGGATTSANPPGLTATGATRAFFRCGARKPNSMAAVSPGAGPHGPNGRRPGQTGGTPSASGDGGGRMFGSGPAGGGTSAG